MAKEGYDKVVELLLHRDDIEVNAADENKRTPLYIAAEMGHHEVVGLLLKREEISVFHSIAQSSPRRKDASGRIASNKERY